MDFRLFLGTTPAHHSQRACPAFWWHPTPNGHEKSRARALPIAPDMGFLGLGAFCETDGVHVSWANCAARQKTRFVGKEGYPTVAFDVSVTHNHEVIYIADWCAGAVNDKTQAVHDQLLQDLHSGTIMPDHVSTSSRTIHTTPLHA